jgi:hypothetical protein
MVITYLEYHRESFYMITSQYYSMVITYLEYHRESFYKNTSPFLLVEWHGHVVYPYSPPTLPARNRNC